MHNVIQLLELKNKIKSKLTNSEILRIFKILISEFRLTNITSINFNSISKYYMSYNLIDKTININVDVMNDSMNYKKFNYDTIFAIVHELNHVKQFEYTLNNDDYLSYIYKRCFDMISSDNLKDNTYYSLFHNLFPIEVNADIESYMYLIRLINSIVDREYEDYYTNILYERLNVYKNDDFQELLKVICGSKIDEVFNSIDPSIAKVNCLIKKY